MTNTIDYSTLRKVLSKQNSESSDFEKHLTQEFMKDYFNHEGGPEFSKNKLEFLKFQGILKDEFPNHDIKLFDLIMSGLGIKIHYTNDERFIWDNEKEEVLMSGYGDEEVLYKNRPTTIYVAASELINGFLSTIIKCKPKHIVLIINSKDGGVLYESKGIDSAEDTVEVRHAIIEEQTKHRTTR